MQLFDQLHRGRPYSGQDQTEQLFSLAIISVAYKMLEVQPLSIECIQVSLATGKFSKEQIKEAEVKVTCCLAFRLHPYNFYHFFQKLVRTFSPLGGSLVEDRLHRVVMAVQESPLVCSVSPFYLGFATFYLAMKI